MVVTRARAHYHTRSAAMGESDLDIFPAPGLVVSMPSRWSSRPTTSRCGPVAGGERVAGACMGGRARPKGGSSPASCFQADFESLRSLSLLHARAQDAFSAVGVRSSLPSNVRAALTKAGAGARPLELTAPPDEAVSERRIGPAAWLVPSMASCRRSLRRDRRARSAPRRSVWLSAVPSSGVGCEHCPFRSQRVDPLVELAHSLVAHEFGVDPLDLEALEFLGGQLAVRRELAERVL